MNQRRVAIIGTGMISHRHMTIYSKMPECKIVAVAEIDAAKLKAWAEKYGMDEKDCYTDFREMLKRDDIDWVDVCVHNNLHAPIAIEVMKAGFPCYSEKPMAGSYADCVKMMDAAKKLDRKLGIQISSIFNLQTRMAKQMVENGDLGRVYHGRSCYYGNLGRPGVDDTMFSKDFSNKLYGGHGVLFDLGIYHISQMLFILGLPELESVYGKTYHEIPLNPRLMEGRAFEVEEFAVGMASFKGNLSLEISEAWALYHMEPATSWITGSTGSIRMTNVDCGGGDTARPAGAAPRAPEQQQQIYYNGTVSGKRIESTLNPYANEKLELKFNPEMQIYNCNQAHWLAYINGVLTDETRYNTPLIASNTALLSEGIFLSQQLGRSVTADEIRAMSVSNAVWDQETPYGVFHYEEP